jgi:class 3 adenylate cyclase
MAKLCYIRAMLCTSPQKQKRQIWHRLLPYFMLLLPLAVINLGFHFLAGIERHWRDNAQKESIQSELEALTRSSSFEYRLNRQAGQFAEQFEVAIETIQGDEQLKQHIERISASQFAHIFPKFKLHVFRKTAGEGATELLYAKSDRVESKRAMSLLFDYMIDQHIGAQLNLETKKQRDKLAESYFGKTVRSHAYASSQKGKTSYILHDNRPHWFIWDYRTSNNGLIWGYFLTAGIESNSSETALKVALAECRERKNGLAGFVPLFDETAAPVAFKELEMSNLFRAWRHKRIRAIDKNLADWLKHGPPRPERLGNYTIHSYLGKQTDYLTVFLAPIQQLSPTPPWIKLFNLLIPGLCLLLSLRGMLLDRWFETGLTFRFLFLYFMAATFPLGMLVVSAAAYHYQTSQTARHQIADNLEECLREIETRKIQIQEEYQRTARQMFTDTELSEMVTRLGTGADQVRNKIVAAFASQANPLPLLGFYLKDLYGEGLEHIDHGSIEQLADVFGVHRAALIGNLREMHLSTNPGASFPELKVPDAEKFGAQAYASLTGNDFGFEMEKRRNISINLRSAEGSANFIFDFIKIDGHAGALLFFVWDDKILFEKSIASAIENFKTSVPAYSFIAFRNTPQGLKTLFRPDGKVTPQIFSMAARVAETSAARGSAIKEHMSGYSVVAMPFGSNSEIIVAGLSDHNRIRLDENSRRQIFIVLILTALLIAALCAYFTAQFLLKPITSLKTALDRVTAGDYSISLDSERADELGALTREFALMVEGVKERERLATLLSDHAVESLSRSDGNIGHDTRAFWGIALVSDIRSFTTLCESQPTATITEMLNHHFAVMARIIAENGGRIYKFIGDAIEAVFDENDAGITAERAVKAAIEMQAAMANINRNRVDSKLFTYACGVGLSRGRFFAGQVGSEDTRLDYSIVGEHFNRAARVEAATKQCPTFPVAYDGEIAELIKNKIISEPVESDEIEAFTIAGDSDFLCQTTASFELASTSNRPTEEIADQRSTTADLEQRNTTARKFKPILLTIFAVFAILAGFAVYKGFAVKNQTVDGFARKNAVAESYRLARQIKSEDAGKMAFETIGNNTVRSMESSLKLEYDAREEELIAKRTRQLVDELNRAGVQPRRVFATACRPQAYDPPQIAFSHGIDTSHQEYFLKLAHYFQLYMQHKRNHNLLDYINPRTREILGTKHDANFIAYERIGSSLATNPSGETEYFYANIIRATKECSALPANNNELANLASDSWRIAGIIFVSVAESQVKENPALLAHAYSERNSEVALISDSGTIHCSEHFPDRLLQKGNAGYEQSSSAEYLLDSEELQLGKQSYRLVIARRLDSTRQIDLTFVALATFLLISLAIHYVYRSLYGQTALTGSIKIKLLFSILLTAVVPMLTAVFVSDYFVFENHMNGVRQQKLDLQRYLDAYELRQFYNQSRVARLIRKISHDPRVITLARELDKDPTSASTRNKLREVFTEFFAMISDDKSWESNAVTRDSILISQKNWEFSHTAGQEKRGDTFAGVLVQIGKYILSSIGRHTQTEKLSIGDVKNEMYFDGAMQSIRSNFGDEAYIRATNALATLVVFEVTTGAAGVVAIPLPSLEKPDFMLMWLLSLGSGSYLTRVALQNKGPYAIFTAEYIKYGKIISSFAPAIEMNLDKAAAWIVSSHLPVSFEQTVGHEKISIEARAGTQQINNLMIGAASQTPIDRSTASIKQYLVYFILMGLLIFVMIGIQTSSDVIVPVGELARGMQHIGQQNYFYRINLDRNDELGQLCASYDRFAKSLAEKEVMGKMLSRSAQLAMAGSADAAGLLLSSKREFVLIFIGSIDFAQRLSGENTEELFKQLKNQAAQLCRIVIENGGDIDKLMGDKILGVFAVGDSNSSGQSARQAAINATRQIIQAEQAGKLHFPVAIGVNAGEVINGMLGFGAKRDFTVIGDAVNVSARIEKEAEKLPEQRCLFSHEFVSGLTDASAFSLHSEAALKGKSATLKLYRFT